jgi:putative NADH-flavin reductase
MNIGVIGATGKLSRMITKTALEHGHDVTALVRSPEKLENQRLPFLKRDILQIERADIQPFSVVINAFGAPVGHEDLYINSIPSTCCMLLKTYPPINRCWGIWQSVRR